MFFVTITTTFYAIVQLLIIAAVAAVCVRIGIVSTDHVPGMSAATVWIFLPCLIITKTITRFDPTGSSLWWILPLAGAAFVFTGLIFAAALFKFDPSKKFMLPLASMQNAVYLPLPIGLILFPDQFDDFALYCFLMVMGQTPITWSLGKALMAGGKKVELSGKDFITPPFVAILISIAIVFLNLTPHIPQPLMGAMDLLGQVALPLAVFILGATLSTARLKDIPPIKDMMVVATVKYALLPAAVFALLYFAGLNAVMPLFCAVLMIQAASPPMTNLILMVKNHGGDDKKISSMMLILNLLCVIAIPVWLALWQFIAN